MNIADFCFCTVLQLMREYGSDIHLVRLEAHAMAKKQFTFKVFFITHLGHILFSNHRIYSRYLVVMACRPTVMVQSQICEGSSAGAELGGCQGRTLPPQNFSGLLKVLHRLLTAPLVAKLAPHMAPPNENVWLRPCSSVIFHYLAGE